jgi:hypothetical protein
MRISLFLIFLKNQTWINHLPTIKVRVNLFLVI